MWQGGGRTSVFFFSYRVLFRFTSFVFCMLILGAWFSFCTRHDCDVTKTSFFVLTFLFLFYNVRFHSCSFLRFVVLSPSQKFVCCDERGGKCLLIARFVWLLDDSASRAFYFLSKLVARRKKSEQRNLLDAIARFRFFLFPFFLFFFFPPNSPHFLSFQKKEACIVSFSKTKTATTQQNNNSARIK